VSELISPDNETPPQSSSTPAWLALPLGVVFILVFGIVALIVVLLGAIVTTAAGILFILLLVPLLLVGLILGLIDELRGKKTTVPKGVSKPTE
jgi:hypothetical protein